MGPSNPFSEPALPTQACCLGAGAFHPPAPQCLHGHTSQSLGRFNCHRQKSGYARYFGSRGHPCHAPISEAHQYSHVRQQMTPVLSIVGRSNTGKTTLIEGLIGELQYRGYKVATMKHSLHGFDIDRKGKDSWAPPGRWGSNDHPVIASRGRHHRKR